MAIELLSDESEAPATTRRAEVPAMTRSGSNPHRDLFLISFLILFAELACIRWFGSTVIFLTFFTNVVLLASFLGMSVGLMTASSRRDLRRTVIPLLTLAVVLSVLVIVAYRRFGRVIIDVGGQGSLQQVYFGTEYRPNDP
ncbi:MAG TPA: hypothetical protein VGH33_10180, partial [Isosphaeraceae bacterium]